MTVRGVRRWGRRGCLAGAVACLGLAVAAPHLRAQVAGAPRIYSGSASAFALQLYPDREQGGLFPIPRLLDGRFMEGSSELSSSGGSKAAAALYYPGGAINGPALLCGEFGDQFPPQFAPILDACLGFRYPFAVSADSTTPDAQTVGGLALGAAGQPISSSAALAQAHVAADSATSDAVISDLRVGLPFLPIGTLVPIPGVNPLDPSLVSIDGITTRTAERFEGGVFVVEAVTHLSGIRLLAGLVQIASVETVSVSRADGREPATTQAASTVGGVTIGGIPASVGSDGLVLGSPTGTGGVLGIVGDLVNQLLGGLGIEIKTLAAEHADGDGTTQGQAVGLGITIRLDLTQVPDIGDIYFVQMALASAGTQAFADDSALPPLAPPSGGSTGGAPGGSTFTPGSPGTPGSPAVPGTPATPAAPAAAAPTANPVRDVVDELLADRVRLVYLAFTLAGLALCLSPRLTLPARLPAVGPPS